MKRKEVIDMETKVTAQEILDTLNKEYSVADMRELYKAMIMYDLGYDIIDKENEKKLNEVIDYYYDSPGILSFINDNLRYEAMGVLED
jgi:uncharacterized protein YjgD (DUF1641 family)